MACCLLLGSVIHGIDKTAHIKYEQRLPTAEIDKESDFFSKDVFNQYPASIHHSVLTTSPKEARKAEQMQLSSQTLQIGEAYLKLGTRFPEKDLIRQ